MQLSGYYDDTTNCCGNCHFRGFMKVSPCDDGTYIGYVRFEISLNLYAVSHFRLEASKQVPLPGSGTWRAVAKT
eukprot:scaffold4234_cov141-Chaetoceros_neogracile.AAC.1